MVIIIDNYDSFVYNLARYVQELGYDSCVIRNDKITLAELNQALPSHIIISPGPGTPGDAGISAAIVSNLYQRLPILGVCLGHQVIGEVFGAEVVKAKKPMHGRASIINHNGQGLFNTLPNPLTVGRYHSLIVNEKKLSKELIITSRSDEAEVMSFAHHRWPLFGVQFHPESILTPQGQQLLANFLAVTL